MLRWLGVKNAIGRLAIGFLLIAILLAAPFVDEIVGMQQFEELCAKRAVIWVDSGAGSVKRGTRGETKFVDLSGNWIHITAQKVTYLNKDTGKTFVSYEILHTSGGRIAKFFLLGGKHSCSPSVPNALNTLEIDKLISEGKQ